jgi:hypothetical protein
MTISRLGLFAFLMCLASSPAFAAPYTYAPEHCEFKITFPEKPYIEQKCTSGEKKQCTEVVTYTKVVTADSSVNVRVTCNQKDPDELARYTPAIMEETIKQMVNDANLETDNTEMMDKNGYKSAAAISIGTRGDREIVYTGQIWIGKTSLFTLEADMTGPQNAEADKLFTDILKDMRPKKELAPKKN